MSDEYKERLRRIRREADKVLFSDGGKHWPIFRVKDELYEDFWPFFERYIKAVQRLKPPSNRKSGKLNLPPYHPVHKNPIWYDDDVQDWLFTLFSRFSYRQMVISSRKKLENEIF